MNLSFRHYYWRWTRNLILLAVFVMVLQTMARIGFALYFSDLKSLLASPTELRKAMVLGWRFDLVPVAYINALPFLFINICYFLPGKFAIKFSRGLIISILTLGYFLLGWSYVFDYSFYSYFQDHLNILFFGFFEDDTVALLTSLWKNYNLPLYLVVFGFFHYGLYKTIKFLFSPFDFDLKVKTLNWKMPANFLLGLVFIAWGARGSFNRLPLSFEDAYFSTNEFMNELSLNGVLTMNRAIKIRKAHGAAGYNYLSSNGYGEDWSRAFHDGFGKKPTQDTLLKSLVVTVPGSHKRAPHVVLIVMESFGSYWNDLDSPEFNLLGDLRDHFKEGLLFKNFLPAENGTIGSIVSVATSQVIRPGARFLSESDYMRTKLSSSGNVAFKAAGYDTHFVYGGKLGWRDLGKFLSVQGYDNLWGAEEIKEAMPEINNIQARDLGNEWGIFDEYLYDFLEEQLKTASKPQLFVVLTTSNHPPFEYPASYMPQTVNLTDEVMNKISVPKEIALKRFLGTQYANQKVAEFLNKQKMNGLKNKVITALTGDHSFWIAKGVGSESEFKRYAVPFFISLPDSLRPAKVDLTKFGSHEDIFPSLFSLAIPGTSYVKLGESLFDDDSHATNSSGLVANKKGAYHHGTFWKWKNLDQQILEATTETPELLELKNHLNGLIGVTDVYLKEEKANTPTASGNDQQ